MGCGTSRPAVLPSTRTDQTLEPVVKTEKQGSRKQNDGKMGKHRSIERLRKEAAETATHVRRLSLQGEAGVEVALPEAGSSSGGGSGGSALTRLTQMSLETLMEEFDKCDVSGERRLAITELSKLLVKLFGEEVLTAVDADGKRVVDSLLAALDTDGSGDVDVDELQAAWRAWFGQALNPKRCLIIVDVQNDFIDGTLGLKGCPAGQDGADVVPVINALRSGHPWDAVVVSLDWHVENHCSFYETVVVEGRSPAPFHESQDEADAKSAGVFATVTLQAPDGVNPMRQTLWPRHCVQDTWGAECHRDLELRDTDVVVRKGVDPRVDSYSAFYDNQKLNQTVLLAELRRLGVTHVFVTGLALDVCVAFTALHAAEEGFVTTVIEDACAGVTHEGIAEKKQAFLEAGINVAKSTDIGRLFSQSSLDEVTQAAHRVQKAKQLVQEYANEDGHAPPSSKS